MSDNFSVENYRNNRCQFYEHDFLEKAEIGLKERIIAGGELPHTSVEEQLLFVGQLCLFPFSNFVVEYKAAHGC